MTATGSISLLIADNQLDLDTAWAAYENALANYDQMISVDYPVAVAELTYRKSSKDQAEKEYRDAQWIAAPWDAILLQSYVNLQDQVEPGKVLARIGKQGGYYVTTELDKKYFPDIDKEKEVISPSPKISHIRPPAFR